MADATDLRPQTETEAPYAQLVAGVLEMANLSFSRGKRARSSLGLRWIRTPGTARG